MPEAALSDVSEKSVSPDARSWLAVAAPILVASYVFGSLVVPGLRGNADEQIVSPCEGVSATLAVASVLFLAMEVVGRGGTLSSARGGAPLSRIFAVSVSGVVLALAFAAVAFRLHPLLAMGLSVAAAAVCLSCASGALSVPESRAGSLLLVAMSMTSLSRTFGWQLAFLAGERADRFLFGVSHYALSASTLLEALGQIMAIAWLGTRGPWRGRLLTNVAVVAAFVATFLAARALSSHSGSVVTRVFATAIARVLHSYVPLSPLSAFLGVSAPLLALVSIVQSRRNAPYAGCVALLLCSRGTFDVPLSALASVVAGLVLLDTRLRSTSASIQPYKDTPEVTPNEP